MAIDTQPITVLVRMVAPEDTVRWVSFPRTVRRWRESGPRRLLLAWLALCVVVVPTGMLTRVFEWTGLPLSLGGAELYLTLYLPMIVCVPLALWLGYWWAAIPAYFSTFFVALIGGMPIAWILPFALANPLGLAVIHLGYRAFGMRPDLRSLASFLYFVLLAFLSSVVGSAGSFVWAYTNEVGLNQFYPVWQGWWLGGFVQSLVLAAPLLAIATPAVERWKDRLGVSLEVKSQQLRWVTAAAAALLFGTVGYVLIVRLFMNAALERALSEHAATPALRADLSNVIAGLALPQWVLVTLGSVTLFFGFRVGLQWAAEYKTLAADLERANDSLRRSVSTDPLTGVHNRYYMLQTLPAMISRAARRKESLACLLFDVDRFKRINDRHGHLAGDSVLKQVAGACRDRLRREDLFARFGGEEFVVVVERADEEAAVALAEELRALVAAQSFHFDGRDVSVTASFGVAVLPSIKAGEGAVTRLLSLADGALYEAKRQGRNTVVCSGE